MQTKPSNPAAFPVDGTIDGWYNEKWVAVDRPTKQQIDFVGRMPVAKINWSCVGSVDVETAKDFHAQLARAIKCAESYNSMLAAREAQHD